MVQWRPIWHYCHGWTFVPSDAELYAEWRTWFEAVRNAKYRAWEDAHYDANGMRIADEDMQAGLEDPYLWEQRYRWEGLQQLGYGHGYRYGRGPEMRSDDEVSLRTQEADERPVTPEAVDSGGAQAVGRHQDGGLMHGIVAGWDEAGASEAVPYDSDDDGTPLTQ